MNRRVGVALSLLVLSGLATGVSAASPAERSGGTAVTLKDGNDDVKFDEYDPGGQIDKGNYGGDIRTVKAALQDRRVVVKVSFDNVKYSRELMTVAISLPASKNGVSYIASLVGNSSTGNPVPSLEQFVDGSADGDPVDCAGFKTIAEKEQWTFLVPRKCLQPREFTRKALVVKTAYKYNNGTSFDRFPNTGKASIK